MRVGGLFIVMLAAAACSKATPPASDTAAATATAMAPANDDAAKEAIGKIRSGWKDAADRKDSAAIAAYYADDATLVGTDIPMSEGKAAIQTSVGKLVAISRIESIDSKETAVSGDVGYDYGTFKQEVTMPNGKKQEINGTYIVTLKKQSDGSWKITRHISNVQPPKT